MSTARIFPACLFPIMTVALAAGAPMAAAQSVVFHEDFEDGLGAWTATGLCNAVSNTDPCGSQAPAFPIGSGAAYWGREAFCNFISPTWAGNLTMPAPVHLPDNFTSARLKFWTYEQVECDVCGWDWRFVYVSTDGGASWIFVGEGDILWQWYQKSIDLTPFIGEDILIRFHFDAVDDVWNEGLGWLIDNVTIEVECDAAQTYCQSAPNSVGPGALVGWSGSLSEADNDFHMEVTDAPPGSFGKFYYGPEAALVPFGDGVRCVGAGALGTFRLYPPQPTDANGALSRHVDFTQPPANAGPGMLAAGDTWYFQFWYRDQAGPGGTGFNLSDGLMVTFCP